MHLLSLRAANLMLSGALLDCVLPSGEWKARDRNKTDIPPVRPSPNLQPLSAELLHFFARRGISAATLEAAGVMQERLYAPPLREVADTIAFTYRRKGQLINVKYRTVDKKFWQAGAVCFDARWQQCLTVLSRFAGLCSAYGLLDFCSSYTPLRIAPNCVRASAVAWLSLDDERPEEIENILIE